MSVFRFSAEYHFWHRGTFHSDDVPQQFQSSNFDFSHIIWWHIHFIVLDCFLFSTLLVHILVRKCPKIFRPQVIRVDVIFPVSVQVPQLYSIIGLMPVLYLFIFVLLYCGSITVCNYKHLLGWTWWNKETYWPSLAAHESKFDLRDTNQER
jgi:hypothetical protein